MCIHELILTFMKTGLLCNCFAWFIKLNYTLNSQNIACACSLNVQTKPNSLVLHMFSGFQQTDAIFNILWWFGSVCQHRHPKGFGQGICTNFQVSVYMYGVCMHVFPAKKTKICHHKTVYSATVCFPLNTIYQTQIADTNCWWVDSQRPPECFWRPLNSTDCTSYNNLFQPR